MLRTSARRGALSRTLSVALLITASGLLVGCDAFRSTKMGYANSTQKDQVRQGEVVQVAVFSVEGKVTFEPQVFPAAAIPLAGVVLDKVITFASGEFQKHLEKVEELHEAEYSGRVVIPQFDPTKTYDIHIVRSVIRSADSKSTDKDGTKTKGSENDSTEKPDDLVEVTRLIYRLTPYVLTADSAASAKSPQQPEISNTTTDSNTGIDTGVGTDIDGDDDSDDDTDGDAKPAWVMIVRSYSGGIEYDEEAHLRKVAVRLKNEREPFELSTSLKFFAANAASEEGTQDDDDASPGQDTPKDTQVPADTNASPDGKKEGDAQSKPEGTRRQLGNTIRDARLVRAGSVLKSPNPVKITPKVTNTVKEVESDSLGYFVVEDPTQLFEIEITVTEKDPSRAAERNKAAREAIKDITPELVKFLKEQAGLNEETEETEE